MDKEGRKSHLEEKYESDPSKTSRKREGYEQKAGRNANSNLLRLFFRRLEHRVQRQPSLVVEALRRAGSEGTAEALWEWVRGGGVDCRSYIRVPQAKGLFCCN